MLQGIVKQFFNEKEVTSTLVMDALHSGCKQVEEAARSHVQVRPAAQALWDDSYRIRCVTG